MKRFILFISLITFLFSCQQDDDINVINNAVTEPADTIIAGFSTDEHYILKDSQPFEIKGVVYVPGYPGYLPWEIENNTSLPNELEKSIKEDISDIKNMGANTIRFWGAPKYCYTALKEIGDLHFLQTIWIDGAYPDFQDPEFKSRTKDYIRSVIDRVYSVYPNEKPPLIAFLVGNELSKESIISTNASHPEIDRYEGNFVVTTEKVNASEAFLAEMADYVKTYEFETYKYSSLVSYSNDIRTFGHIDTPFLDFRSQNAYSYAVPYYRPSTSPGANSGTLFQGYIEEVKSQYPEIPLLITETGLSVSPNVPQTGPPNYGYGGNTEAEQAAGIIQNISDIESANLPLAGVCVHEYLDAWWKFSLEDSYSQDPNDIEEWFGMAKLIPTGDWYETEFRPLYTSLKGIWDSE